MHKFIALVKNEYIKLFSKISTILMLALVILVSGGLSLLVYYAASLSVGSSYSWQDNYDWETQLKNEISYAQSSKYEGWEQEVTRLEFQLENKIWTWTDWRNDYVMAALGRDDYNETQAKTIKQALGNDDWKAVYKVVIEYNSSIEWKTKEEKELDNWFYSYCIENDIRPERSGKDWKFNLVERLADEKKQAARLESNRQKDEPKSHEQESLENKIAVSQYRLDKNISKNVADLSGGIFAVFNASESIDMWAIMYALLDLVSYLGVFFVIIAGGMVSSEFTGGTIKFLLINPVKRWKILASKYFVTIVTGYLFLILAFTIASMCVGIFSGFANADALYIVAENGKVSAMPALIKVIQLTLLQSVSVVVMATLAFAISSMVRSSALAIGVSLFALVSGSIINTILMVLEADWGRFLIFSNTDLVSIANGLAPYDGQTLPFAIGVIAVHMVIFLLMAWDGFTKREV